MQGELEREMEKVAVRDLTSRGLRSARKNGEDGRTFVMFPTGCEATPTAKWRISPRNADIPRHVKSERRHKPGVRASGLMHVNALIH